MPQPVGAMPHAHPVGYHVQAFCDDDGPAELAVAPGWSSTCGEADLKLPTVWEDARTLEAPRVNLGRGGPPTKMNAARISEDEPEWPEDRNADHSNGQVPRAIAAIHVGNRVSGVSEAVQMSNCVRSDSDGTHGCKHALRVSDVVHVANGARSDLDGSGHACLTASIATSGGMDPPGEPDRVYARERPSSDSLQVGKHLHFDSDCGQFGKANVSHTDDLSFYVETDKKIDALYWAVQREVRCLNEIRAAISNHIARGFRQSDKPASGNPFPAEPMRMHEWKRKKSFNASSPIIKKVPTATKSEHSLRPQNSGESLPVGRGNSPRSPKKTKTLQQLEQQWSELTVQAGLRESVSPRKSSVWTYVADNLDLQKHFLDTFMGLVIITNSFTIGVSSDVGDPTDWLVVDAVFASLYLLEIVYKFSIFGCSDFFKGGDARFNVFELVLVFCAWGEVALAIMGTKVLENTRLLSLFRGIRLVRITRLLRVLRLQLFSDLKVMMMGTLGGMRTLLWSAVLIFWPLYIACLILRETLGDNREGQATKYFTSMPTAFFTLFRCVVVGECTDHQGRPIFVFIAEENGWGFALIYGILTMFMTFGLFNVIIALFVENVVAAAKSNDMLLRKHRLRDKQFFNSKMYDLIDLFWEAWQKKHNVRQRRHLASITSADNPEALAIQRLAAMDITQELFDEVGQDKRLKEILQDLDVADDDQFDLFNVLDANRSGTIELPELKQGVARLRGDARRGDIVAVRVLVEEVLDAIRDGHDFRAGSRGSGCGYHGAAESSRCDPQGACTLPGQEHSRFSVLPAAGGRQATPEVC